MFQRESRGVSEFLLWCAKHRIEIDERVEIRVSSVDDSLSVFSKPKTCIPIGETLVRIPKSIVFSTKNCSRSRDLAAYLREDDDPALTLSLAFLLETLVGPVSRWCGYFASLPIGVVNIAVFWGVNGDQDGVGAKQWLRGTEAAKILDPPESSSLLERINAYFRDQAEPILSRMQLCSTLADFHRAYSIVSSRAFLVDAYLGLSLVPVADLFNHVEDHHVHLESDYHVCQTCGSLDECEHDDETPDRSSELVYSGDDICEMVTNLPIGPGQEVFNTYETGLTNAELICQYGFTLDVNENNLVTWSIDELLNAGDGRSMTLQIWSTLVSRWPHHPNWEESGLVFNSRTGENAGEDDEPKRLRRRQPILDLNADAQISHELWLLLFVLSLDLPDGGADVEDILTTAKGTGRMLTEIESCLGDHTTGIANENQGTVDNVRKIAKIMEQICEVKIGSAHCAEASVIQIGEELDEMPANRTLTRRAIVYALEERKLLESCHMVWREVAEECGSRQIPS